MKLINNIINKLFEILGHAQSTPRY